MPHGVHVTVNAAMSADGRIALAGGKSLRLSGDEDFARVHRMRHEHDAILVGVGTVLQDDPSLLVKEQYVPDPRHPLRVVLDSHLRTPRGARVLDERAPTLLAVAPGHARPVPGADVVACGGRGRERALLEALRDRGVRSLMVEGGGTVIRSFLNARLVDDAYVYVAPVVVGGGAPSLVEGEGATEEAGLTHLALVDARPLGDGALLHWRPRG